jgi:hypothetical protein
MLGPVNGLLQVGEELFGALVGLAPGDRTLLGECGEGRGGVTVGEADGVGMGDLLPEPFLFLPLVERRRGIVEGDLAFMRRGRGCAGGVGRAGPEGH